MHEANTRQHPYTVAALALLVAGLAAVYVPRWPAGLLSPAGYTAQPGFTYIADLDYWQRTDREQTVTATAAFDLAHDLDDVPLALGEWQGEDVPQTNVEVFILLEPEQYVQRLYRDGAGHYVWLSLIGGRSSRPFHPPDLCYGADGWRTSLTSQSIPLDQGTLRGLWLEAVKAPPDQSNQVEQLAFYFFLFPNADRNPEDGIVLAKLTSPRYGTTAETLAVQGRFLRHLFSAATPTRGS